MFIVSTKVNVKKAISCVLLCAALLIGIILLAGALKRPPLPGATPVTAATDGARIAFLEDLGWEADPSPMETLEFVLPQPLNDSYLEYNELQLQQGFDLTPYAGMQVKRYSYAITNYPDRPDHVQADLYLCGDALIGGDILCSGENGFVGTLVFPE